MPLEPVAPADTDVDKAMSKTRRVLTRVRRTTKTVVEHVVTHTGVGIVCAVAYFDP